MPGPTRKLDPRGAPSGRRNVNSATPAGPIDAHERTRDYLTEDEFRALVESAKRFRYHWRNTAMLLLMFYHGLRASEVCHLRRRDVDLHHGRIWIQRVKGKLILTACEHTSMVPSSYRAP